MIRILLGMISLSLLSACGGGDSTQSQQTENSLKGYFVDSAVENLNYITSSGAGSTDESGEFTYLLDEDITFSVGDITFPTVPAESIMTPLALFATDDIDNSSVVNTLRLLQSLDADGDVSNGIVILPQAHTLASGLSVDFSSDNFDEQVSELVANNGAVSTTLITANQATSHFQATLDDLNLYDSDSCEATHDLVGLSAEFSTLAHQVSGTATVIDDCTIEVTNFNYDATAPAVYFYAGSDGEFSDSNAFAISEQLRSDGTDYSNETITLNLPEGKTLDDFNSISVWCEEFSVNFGDISFN